MIDTLIYLSACAGSATLSVLSMQIPGTTTGIYRSLRGVPLSGAAGAKLTAAVRPLGHYWLLSVVALALALPCLFRRRRYLAIAVTALALLAITCAGMVVD